MLSAKRDSATPSPPNSFSERLARYSARRSRGAPLAVMPPKKTPFAARRRADRAIARRRWAHARPSRRVAHDPDALARAAARPRSAPRPWP